MTFLLGLIFVLLRSRTGVVIQAIRDNEEAAERRLVEVRSRSAHLILAGGLPDWPARCGSPTPYTFQPETISAPVERLHDIHGLVGGLGASKGHPRRDNLLSIETVFARRAFGT